MEKYATYSVYQHKETGEIKKIPTTDSENLEKLASDSEWVELNKDPDYN